MVAVLVMQLIITREMIQQVECPKCGAKIGNSCGHRRDKSRSHHKRLEKAQRYFNPKKEESQYNE